MSHIQFAEIFRSVRGSGKQSSDENRKNCNWLHKDAAEITITKHFENR